MSRFLFVGLLMAAGLCCQSVYSQDPFGGKKPTPEQIKKMQEMRRKAAEAQGAKPGQTPSKEGEGEKKSDDKKGEGKEEKPASIKRSDTKPTERDPAELRKMRVDDDGKIQLSIEGQSWRHIIEWLGEISGMPIDWTELPNDYLNLTTQRSYTPPECRNIINRNLLSRGYTLIEEDGFLSVHKTEGLNPTLVPRLKAEELGDHQAYEFVRVSFKLKWMLAEQAVTEFATLKSKNGTLTALATTNRLEAVDTVKSLKLIHSVLQEEQSTESEEDLVEEFELIHIRAVLARQKLEELLGIESKKESRGGPSNSRDMQRMQQQMMEAMQQQMRQRGGDQGKKSTADPGKVRFIVNEQRNSVIAHAPPDKMAIVKRAVKLLDVPSGSWDSLEEYIDRTKTYRLVSLTPSEVIQILQETGGMDPSTVLRADDGSKSIIASAPPWDHLKITKLVEKLDGSARKLKAVPLRRLFADEVAGTLQALMVGPKKEDNSRRRYSWWDDYGRGSGDDKKETDSFRIDADVENNRLLLWCNEKELTKVMEFLEELGEVRSTQANPSRYRVIDAFDPDEEDALLKRLKQAFEGLAPNELQLPEPIENKRAAEGNDDATSPSPPKEAPSATPDKQTVVPGPRSKTYFKTAQLKPELPQGKDDGTPASKVERQRQAAAQPQVPPVKISRGRDGKLVITCQDPRALDLLEELLAEMAPTKKDYHVFELEVATPTWVVVNLEDYFEEDDKYNERFNAYWFDMPLDSDENKSRLSRRRPVRFIADDDTSTILVQDASREQLKTIASLIELYDTVPKQTQAARISDVFPIKHHRASEIAEVIKDAYRDLLSDNDKALQGAGGGKKEQKPETYIRTYNFGPSNDSGSDSERTRVTFKGKLSMGIDDTTNSLVVTTEGENLMSLIRQMVEKLDTAAGETNTFTVMKVSGGINAQQLQEALTKLTGGKTAKPTGKPQGPQQPKRQEGGEERGRREE